MKKASILTSCPLFADLSPAHIERLSGETRYRSISRREILFVEEDPGRSMFVLGSGAIQLYKTAEDGSETVIKIVRPGEPFAEVILFEQRTYPVTAVAIAASELLEIPKDAVRSLLAEEGFRDDFISTLLRRQKYLAQKLHEMTSLDVEERFFRFLREHYGDRKIITVDISKKDFAAAIGATPETLSRLIMRLEQAGVLEWAGKEIRIK